MSARRFAPLGFVQTRRELLLKLRLNKKKTNIFFLKRQVQSVRHASVFPVPAGTGGRTLFAGEEGRWWRRE